MNQQEEQLPATTEVPWMNAIIGAKEKFTTINKINNFVSYDKEAMFAMQIIQKSDYLKKIANQNPGSLRNAVINIAAIGLSLNPAEKLAYIVPRKGEACLDISYIGLIKLATDTGSVLWARAELVHENDEFVWHGAAEKPGFSAPNPFNAGKVIGVYCVIKTKEGDYLSGKMSIDEIYDIRNRSEAYKQGYGPWVTDEGEMIKKTIIKRESKTWPKTDKTERLDNAIGYLNEHEGIEFSSNMIGTDPIDQQKLEETYIRIVEIINADDFDLGHDEAKELYYLLTQDEQLALNSKLQKYKPGKRQYNTLFKEYLEYMPNPDSLIEHRIE